jgi:hypothetical protein
MRVSGKEHALEWLIIPQVVLLEMWRRDVPRLTTLFHHLPHNRIREGGFAVGDRWPTETSFSLLVEDGEPAVTDQYGVLLKKNSTCLLG